MKLKTVEVGGKVYAEVLDGKPIYVGDDQKEVGFDAPHTVNTIARLNSEAKAHREAKEAAELKLKGFEGIADPEAARKAIETVTNLDSGQLVTAGKVQEIKDAAAKAARDQVEAAAKASALRIRELEDQNKKIEGDLFGEKVGGAFGRSKFIADKVAVPGDMIQAMFGQRFKVEDGKVIGYDAAGNKMYSRAKPGEVADFDESLEMMIDSYANRDTILKGTGNSGAGSKGDTSGKGGAGKSITRAEFDAMAPMEKAALSKDIATRKVAVVD